MKKISKILNRLLIIIIGLIAIVFIGGSMAGSSKSSNNDLSSMTFEEIAEDHYSKYFRNIVTDSSDTGYIINVDMPTNVSNKLRLTKFRGDFSKFLEKVKDKEFDKIHLNSYIEVQDKLGNIEEIVGATIVITHETINKINFENFNPDNLEEISEEYRVYYGLRK
ncbi:hypothetical protein ACWOBH_05540 [Globicatella sanguinis]